MKEPMTVAELRRELDQCEDDAEVVIAPVMRTEPVTGVTVLADGTVELS